MGNKREFGDGIVYTITKYIWWFLLGNFYFAVTNILFIIVWLSTSTQGTSGFNLIFVVSMLPAGPALVALLSTMGKLLRENDVNITKDFFNAYKKNFLEALFYWSVLLIVLNILNIDIIFFSTKSQIGFIKIILLAVTFIIISMTFYIFPIITRFYFKARDVFRFSLYFSFKKIHITILNWLCIAGLSYIYIKTSSNILFFFFWSILCYLIMFNSKAILSELEEKYVNTNSEAKERD